MTTTLSCNLKSTRQTLHLTRKAVADSIGISVSTLADYENGHATPSFRVLVQLAKLYHSSTDYLRDLSEKTSAPLWKRKCACQALSISRGGSVLNVNHGGADKNLNLNQEPEGGPRKHVFLRG